MTIEKKGMMFILSSPSGTGKTTLTKKLAEHNKKFAISISHTTRKPRLNEINGKDYHFVSIEKFNSLIKKNNFYEHANIFDILFDIDWQGTQQLKKIEELSIVTIFILPPNIQVLKNRLLSRHKDQEELIEERMNKFNEEVSHWNEYNYVVINDDLNICYDNILKIITSEKKDIKQEQNFNEVKKKIEELTK